MPCLQFAEAQICMVWNITIVGSSFILVFCMFWTWYWILVLMSFSLSVSAGPRQLSSMKNKGKPCVVTYFSLQPSSPTWATLPASIVRSFSKIIGLLFFNLRRQEQFWKTLKTCCMGRNDIICWSLWTGAHVHLYLTCSDINPLFLFQVSVPMTDGLDPIVMLTDDATVAAWHNQGLPNDRMSAENAAILTTSERWPLIIDPQQQGVKWVRKWFGPELRVVRMEQKGWEWKDYSLFFSEFYVK